MSVAAMTAVFKATGISPTETLLLLAIADRASGEGLCFPSNTFLAEMTKLSRRTVVSTMKALEGRGILKRTPRRRGDGSHSSNEIWLDTDALGGATDSPPLERETVGGRERAAPLEPRTNQEDRTNARESARLPGLHDPKPALFEEAWKAFPTVGRQRSSKLKSKPQWDKAKARAGGEAKLLTAVKRFAESPDALKDGGNYVKAFDLWLRDGRWEYWLDNSPAPTRPTGEADWF